MDDVISIAIKPSLNHYWILAQYKREGYEVIDYNYNHFLHEHFYLLRKA